MKPENKNELVELSIIKHHLESLGALLDKRHAKGKLNDGQYQIFKGFNTDSIKAVEAEIAAL